MKKRRVLVIDDEKAIRQTLSEILTDEGYAVTAVESGEEGLRRLKEESFDLAFLDVWLRDRDGLSILEAADGRLQEVPVVMISGHANVETAVRAVRLGAYDFLEKPLALERVILTAQKAIERRDLLAEVASLRGAERVSGNASRRFRPNAPAPPGDLPRGADRRPRPDHRRERHGQGARRAVYPPPLHAGRFSPGRGQLRGDPRGVDRV
jgi:DNA-binding NtrC family response regulator